MITWTQELLEDCVLEKRIKYIRQQFQDVVCNGSQSREEIEAVRTDEVKKTLDKVLEGLSMSIQGLSAIPQE